MNRKLLLISNSTNRGEDYLGWCKDMIKDFCNKHGVKDVLFIPYAGVSMGYDIYEEKVKAVFSTLGLNLYSIHKEKDAVKAVRDAKCVAVGGGNTFHLVYELYRNNCMKNFINLSLLTGNLFRRLLYFCSSFWSPISHLTNYVSP